MKHYEKYNAEDLLVDPLFLAWVKHRQPEAEQFWEEWQRQHPDRRAAVLLAKDMAEALSNRPGRLSVDQAREEVAQIMRLTRHLPATRRNPVLRLLRYPVGLITAAVGLIIGGIWMLWPSNQLSRPNRSIASHEPVKPSQWVNQVNGTSQPIPITLPDSSRMTLFPNSRASYLRAFSQAKREIYLKGEAVFAVVHDSRRPFLVMSGPLVTKVLGTRFRVRTLPDESRITVSVQRGKVSVYKQTNLARSNLRHGSDADMMGVVLTANQQVIYQAEHDSYQKQLVLQPALINPEQFVFQDTPVSTVFDRLQKGFGITITYDVFLFRQCTVTASLTDVSLRDQLKLICASIGATYEIVDTQIIISGKGCQ